MPPPARQACSLAQRRQAHGESCSDALEQELLQLLPDAAEHVAGRGGVQVDGEASSPSVEAKLRHGSRHAGRRMNKEEQ